jgi:hypothetical protein
MRNAIAILWVASLAPGTSIALGQDAQGPETTTTTTTTTEEIPKIPDDQLDSLVAPIALYPDPLLSQTLVASTYPLEIIQLQQWMDKNKKLKDKALADAVQKQPWDPSIQSMVAIPDVVQRLAGNIQWTTELGNAFLAQPSDVMNAVQRMRAKAQETNVLVSNTQQTVGTEVVEGGQEVITIQQANPKVIYVPSYDPVVVYGAPAYPYPVYTYPGYIPGTGLAFGAGLVLGAAWGGGWGYNCGWHGNCDVHVNYNNNYINHYNNINNINRGQQGGNWAHQPAHRGGAPYGDRGTAGRYGGRTVGQKPGSVGGVGGVGGVGRPGGPAEWAGSAARVTSPAAPAEWAGSAARATSPAAVPGLVEERVTSPAAVPGLVAERVTSPAAVPGLVAERLTGPAPSPLPNQPLVPLEGTASATATCHRAQPVEAPLGAADPAAAPHAPAVPGAPAA